MSTDIQGAIEPSAAVAAARERAEAEAAEQAAVVPEPKYRHLPSGSLEDPANWQEIRDLFTIVPDHMHLNAGTMGSAPKPVLDVLGAADRQYAARPADPYPPTTLAETRGVLARSYGCDFDEIAVVQGAADGNARILNGIDLEPGDEVLTTTHECYTMHAPLNVLHNRRGIVVTKLTPPLGPDTSADEIVEMFASAITSRTKVIEWAGVTFTVGTRFPTRALAELAHRHGLISIVDGAHLPGQFELNLHETGVDFFSGSGAKYQCGPMGTGILYARNKVLPEYNPLPLPRFWPVISLWYPVEGVLPPRTTGREHTSDVATLLQKTGSADLSRGPALQAAREIWDRIGQRNIETYVLGLSRHLKQRIVDHWGPEALYSPWHDERLHSGIVAFQPFTDERLAADPRTFVEFEERMEREYGINLRFTFFPVRDSAREHYAVRLAPHLYNNHDEMDRAADALIKLTKEMS